MVHGETDPTVKLDNMLPALRAQKGTTLCKSPSPALRRILDDLK